VKNQLTKARKLTTANQINLILYSYCLVLFSYVLYRACSVSFTYDEVSTIHMANSEKWANLDHSSNNHFLNILLIKACLLFFDPSDLVYRLPNVLGFTLFLTYAVKIGKLLKPSAPYFSAILLTSTPFILDFFGLSRGYGLALAFILASIYFLLKYCGENKIKFGIASLLFGILAVFSNFTSFNYFVPSLFILFGYTLFSKEKVISKTLILAVITGAFLYYILPVVFQLKNIGELFFGGRTSLYHDTILSLSQTFAYHKLNISFSNIVFSTLFLIATIFSFVNILSAIRKKCFDIKVVLSVLFFLSLLSPVAQHIIFDTSFPTGRTALLYYPILILALVNGMNNTFVWMQDKFIALIAYSFLVHLMLTSNFTHCYSWRFDSGSKEVVSILMEENNQKENNSNVITIGIDYLYNPSISYHRDSYSFNQLVPHEVVQCWEYDMDIEELNPKYYGNMITRKNNLTREEADKIVSTNYDYYYLNDFVIKELSRHGYCVHVKKQIISAGASLVTLK